MSLPLEEIRDQQRATWNKFSPSWKKWDDLNMDLLKPMGDEIIRSINPRGAEVVLDIAAGTGEPGLTIATMLKGGKVVITDLSEDMLEIARENAMKRDIKNIETRVCDVCALPFADNTFDAISCRLGFMFFPDMLLAAKEMVRVLKPGGKIATSVWNVLENNFWITAILETISRHMDLPAPLPGARGMFRCAKEGLISDLFLEAGLKNIKQKEIAAKMQFKTADIYWDMMTEVITLVVLALNNAEDDIKENIRKEVYHLLDQKYPAGNILMDSSALLIEGVK
ncbi:MAG: methyltransferase domain-containing protein [Saprospiraceae bacterium]|nr:methyltransferase domain-containing protein [Saprospiraceae bacterium]